MKNFAPLFKILAAFAWLALVPACSTPSGGVNKENLLIAAGFRAKLAATPQQRAHLLTLPPNTVTQVTRQGATWYVYPDPAKNELLFGTPSQYQYYVQLKAERNAALQDDATLRMDADTQSWSVWGENWERQQYVLIPGQ